MKKLSVKKNIKLLFELEDDIVIVNSKHMSINEQLVPIEKYNDFYKIRKNIYAIKNNSVYRLEKQDLKFCKISDKTITEKIVDENTTLISEYISLGKYNTTCYFKDEREWNKKSSYLLIENTNILLERDAFKVKNVSKTNLKTGESEWHFTLPEGFTIYKSIQVVDGVMFFKATKGGNDFKNVYGLDIKTGKVLWEQHFKVPYTQNNITSHINHKNNLCYGYGGSLYQVFNPVTGKMVFEKDMSEHYKQGIDPFLSRNFIHDNMLYFVSGRDERAKFGALNLETSEIEFVQDYPFKKGGQFYQIIYHKEKLYLLDSNKTLHIFEDL